MSTIETKKIKKKFNTAGLCFPGKHYMIDPIKRLNKVERLIEDELYFTLHAPRQTGKTTYLHALTKKLNSEGKYIALVVSFEQAGYDSITVERANEVLVDCIYRAALRQLPPNETPKKPENVMSIQNYLEDWASSQEKPIVLLIDEIDALMDNVLISMLRQFRDGYQSRPRNFPSSIVLVGLRDVRDYKVKIREELQSYGTASPFNIKSDSLVLKNFSRDDVFELLEQHTQETGQVFPGEVKEQIFHLSKGQPWLVNALARQTVSEILEDDYSREITPEILIEAKRELILRRDTHLDSLSEKLREPRVKKLIQAIVNGDNMPLDIYNDDVAYVRDLGIVGLSDPLEFANPIYAEFIPRMMAYTIQVSIPKEIQPPFFINPDGTLNMEKLLKEFQAFYRRNSEFWLDRFEYKESAHHLLLMAFLQRVINSGGEVTREMAIGNRRIDLSVTFRGQEFALELKIKRDKDTIEDGKVQLDAYLDKLGLNEGYLVIFDPGAGDWETKLFYKDIHYNGKKIIMVGL